MTENIVPLYPKTAWACATKFKPPAYDLLMLEMEDGQRVPGWWTGTSWDGRRKVIFEKKVVSFKNLYNLEHGK